MLGRPVEKLASGDFLGHHKYDKSTILHDGTIDGALPVHTTFSDLDHIPRSWIKFF